ncbi:MAG: response regulator [Thermomicrobiales bacterium]|nr:response regulator [Thermomicrobiales bacterium]
MLIVDDDRPIVEALASVLMEEGYRVRKAFDGLSALQEAEIQPPDLVLSDIAMPGMNGISLAERLRERGIRVVLLSAAIADPRLLDVEFVPKPFDLDRIVEVVGRQLDDVKG